MTTAVETDKEAIKQQFRAEIREHTIADLQGKAPAHVRDKLRSRDFLNDWRIELIKFQQLGGTFGHAAQLRLVEAKLLSSRHQEQATDRIELVKVFSEEVYPVPENITAAALQVLAQIENYKLLKKLNKTLSKMHKERMVIV